jgi:hypothetical protein
VTRSFPHAVAGDARFYLRAYRQERHDPEGDVRGALAAYVADEYLLGTPAKGWRLVNAALRRGELRGDSYWPGGRSYVKKLKRFLQHDGYAVRP